MTNCIKDGCLEETRFTKAMKLIQGKYKLYILFALSVYGVVRYNELKNYIKCISFKMLSANLKELEKDGLITRKEYPQIPPKVEYSLSDLGKSLMPILDQLCDCGEKFIGKRC